MKKIYLIGSIVCLSGMLLALSCTKESAPVQSKTYVISANSDNVKTSLEGNQVLWNENDRVACISYDTDIDIHSVTKGIAPVSFSGKSAQFEVTTTSGMPPRILVNPSADGYGLVKSKNALQMVLPSEFEAEAGKVSGSALYSVGIIENEKTVMRNILSYFKIEIESANINKLRLSSLNNEGLSGTVLFDLTTLSAIEGETNVVSIIPKDGAKSFSPGVYYIPVPSGTLEKGFQLKFYTSDGKAAKKNSEKAYSVPRNKFVNLGKESDLGLVFEEGTKVFDILFSDGTTAYFPFSDNPDAKTAVTMPKKDEVLGKKVGPYYLVGMPDYPFYFTVMNTSGKTSYFVSQASYGLRLGGTTYDNILLPAVKDFKLVKMYIQEGSQTRSYCVTTDSSQPELISDAKVSVDKNKDKTLTFKNTSSNTAYRLAMPGTDASAIKRLTLTYEAVD